MKKLFMFLTFVMLAGLLTGQTTITINPTDDAKIVESSPSTNYGTSTDLMARVEGNPNYYETKSLIKWNLPPSFPSDALILSATLTLETIDARSTIGLDCYAKVITSTWAESTVTWNTKPTTTSSDLIAFELETNPLGMAGNVEPVVLDITDIVQAWVDEDYSNYGLMLEAQNYTNGTDIFTCYSSDYSGGFYNQPVVKIKYWSDSLWVCGDDYYDTRDGTWYGTVQIGDQCWMDENMVYDNGYIHEHLTSTYGYYYEDYDYTNHFAGICPGDFEIPSVSQFEDLVDEVDEDISELRIGGSTGFDALINQGYFDEYGAPWHWQDADVILYWTTQLTYNHADAFYLSETGNSYGWTYGFGWSADAIRCIYNSSKGSNATNIDEINGINMLLYPNPSSGIITVNFENESNENINIDVITYLGQTVASFDAGNDSQINKTIDLSSYSKGVYFVVIKTAEKTHMEKVIIQ